MKTILRISVLLILIGCPLNKVLGQEQSSYKMTLVKVINEEQESRVKVVLKVSPTVKNFRLILSGRAEYSFGRKTIQANIQKDPNIQIVIYGDDFQTEVPELYNLLNDLQMGEDDFLLVFNISKAKAKGLEDGHFKYGLWESDNPKIRNEKTFYFDENLIIKS